MKKVRPVRSPSRAHRSDSDGEKDRLFNILGGVDRGAPSLTHAEIRYRYRAGPDCGWRWPTTFIAVGFIVEMRREWTAAVSVVSVMVTMPFRHRCLDMPPFQKNQPSGTAEIGVVEIADPAAGPGPASMIHPADRAGGPLPETESDNHRVGIGGQDDGGVVFDLRPVAARLRLRNLNTTGWTRSVLVPVRRRSRRDGSPGLLSQD